MDIRDVPYNLCETTALFHSACHEKSCNIYLPRHSTRNNTTRVPSHRRRATELVCEVETRSGINQEAVKSILAWGH